MFVALVIQHEGRMRIILLKNPIVTSLLHADRRKNGPTVGQTDRQNEANSRFS
jgi:hypothetical protein